MKIKDGIYVMETDVTRENILRVAPEVRALAKAGRIEGFVAIANGIRYGLNVVPLVKGKEYEDLRGLRSPSPGSLAPPMPRREAAREREFTAPLTDMQTARPLASFAVEPKDHEIAVLRGKINAAADKIDAVLRELRR